LAEASGGLAIPLSGSLPVASSHPHTKSQITKERFITGDTYIDDPSLHTERGLQNLAQSKDMSIQEKEKQFSPMLLKMTRYPRSKEAEDEG